MFFGEIYDSIRGRIDCRQKIKPESDRLLESIASNPATSAKKGEVGAQRREGVAPSRSGVFNSLSTLFSWQGSARSARVGAGDAQPRPSANVPQFVEARPSD